MLTKEALRPLKSPVTETELRDYFGMQAGQGYKEFLSGVQRRIGTSSLNIERTGGFFSKSQIFLDLKTPMEDEQHNPDGVADITLVYGSGRWSSKFNLVAVKWSDDLFFVKPMKGKTLKGQSKNDLAKMGCQLAERYTGHVVNGLSATSPPLYEDYSLPLREDYEKVAIALKAQENDELVENLYDWNFLKAAGILEEPKT